MRPRRAGSNDVLVTGECEIRIYHRGWLVEVDRTPNLVTSNGLELMARRISGSSATDYINRIGFGTSGTATALGDTALTGGLSRAIGAATYPSKGKVQFAWNLPGNEGNGTTIREIGLLAGMILVARKVRAAVNKTAEVSITGTWTLTFS